MTILQECFEGFWERFSHPFWRPFIVSWVIINWQAFYASIFLSEETILRMVKEDKLTYIIWLYKETFLGNGLEVNIFIFCIALPLIVTIFNARVISPVMGLWFYEKDCETKERKKRAKRKAAEIAEKEVSEEKLERLVIQENVLEKEMAINIRKQDIEREKTKEEVWTDEYNAFREAVPTGLRSLYSSIYEHNGLIMDTLSTFILPTDIVALADANGIIEKNANIIRLTEKGQFFMKLYIKDKIARKQG